MSGWRRKIGSFTIDRKLPSLNEYINACRSNRYAGCKFKKDIEMQIGRDIQQAMKSGQLPVFDTTPCEIEIIWYEENWKRDADNIQSAQKYILDALQRFGIIKNDSRKYISQIHHQIKQDSKTWVSVMLIETLPAI